jgi:hypothetical protein
VTLCGKRREKPAARAIGGGECGNGRGAAFIRQVEAIRGRVGKWFLAGPRVSLAVRG